MLYVDIKILINRAIIFKQYGALTTPNLDDR